MKKKLLVALIAISSAICGAFGFSACFDNNKVDNGNGGNTNQGGNTQKSRAYRAQVRQKSNGNAIFKDGSNLHE